MLGVERFMSEALTNLIGNAVATLVVARSAGELWRVTLPFPTVAGSAAPMHLPDVRDRGK